MEINMQQLLPKFILNDEEGQALADAVGAGLQMWADHIESALVSFREPDAMTEERLDEVAHETGIPYDINADIEVKRAYVANAYRLSAMAGTVQGIVDVIKLYATGAAIVQDTELATFDVTVIGSDELEGRVINDINAMKSVRTSLGTLTFE